MAVKHHLVAFYGLIVLFGYIGYLVLAPFLSYLIMGLLFAFIFYPIYKGLSKFLWDGLSAGIVIILTLMVIVIPGIYLGGTIISQATSAYQVVQTQGLSAFDESSVSEYVYSWIRIDVEDQVVDLFKQARQGIKNAVPRILTSTGTFLIGLFILFFVMYYALKDGVRWYNSTINILPLEQPDREKLSERLVVGTRALLYGHIATSLLIGIAIGLVFFFAGISNAIFWGFVMVILGLIPFLGAPIVYLPAAIIKMWQGEWIAGIIVLVISAALHLYVDNILRPQIVSSRSSIHPVVVIVGVIGGIVAMGVVGFLVGPLVLSILVTLLSFDYPRSENSRREKRKGSTAHRQAQARN